MKGAVIAPCLLAAAGALHADVAHAQARGPSYEQIREEGVHLIGAWELRQQAAQRAAEQAEQERIALLDPAERARRFAALDAILRRLPGRFRIDGRLEKRIDVGTTRTRDITGMADCTAVGAGLGLNCIINASWPIIEDPPPASARTVTKPPSEALDTMRPAVLVVGLYMDPPGIRAMMVTADTLAFNWVGKLADQAAVLRPPSPCQFDVRCYQQFELIAGPDSQVVEFVLRARDLTFRLTMQRDTDATIGKPLKPLKMR